LIRSLLAARYAEIMKAQQELRAKEEQLSALGDNLPGGMTYQIQRGLDGSMHFLYLSQGVEQLHGVSVEAAMKDASALYELILEEDRPALQSAELESLRQEKPFRHLARSRRKTDGQIRWFEYASAPRQLPDGHVIWDGIQMDVTDRKEAEFAAQQTQARFTHIFDKSPIPITLSDVASGRLVAVNASFVKYSGYSPEEAIGRTVQELQIYAKAEHRTEILQQLRDFGRAYGVEVAFRRKDGAVLANQVWVDELTIGADKFIMAMSLDVSERNAAMRQQRELEEQLRQTQKLEALGTLAGGIAHDFNNILGAIISYTELSKLDNPDNQLLHDNLEQVLGASQRAAVLVRQILSFSRHQKEERRSLQLAPIVKEVLLLLRATLPSTIALDSLLDADVSDVLANATQVHQIVMNLCTNAAHAMRGRQGKITVSVAQIELSPHAPKPHVDLGPGRYVRLVISDTGHGMDAATLRRIFEPFFTTKSLGEGTGLGLSVVHGIVKEYGGAVVVESELGKGTKFTIYLPALSGTELQPLAESAEIPRGRGERILFVDDEVVLGTASRKMLERLGYGVTLFHSSVAALAAFRQGPDAFAALVTDYTMPEMTGVELIREVHAIRPLLPVIMVSGSSGPLDPDDMRRVGMRELLSKPLGYAALAHALRRALTPAPATAAPP
jgi:PAS domain S-box-containing protein